jgi:hypothetical protein
MLLQDIKEIKDGRLITFDGGPGSGVEGHKTPEEMSRSEIKERISYLKNVFRGGVGLRPEDRARFAKELDDLEGLQRNNEKQKSGISNQVRNLKKNNSEQRKVNKILGR